MQNKSLPCARNLFEINLSFPLATMALVGVRRQKDVSPAVIVEETSVMHIWRRAGGASSLCLHRYLWGKMAIDTH